MVQNRLLIAAIVLLFWLDKLSDQVDSALDLRPGVSFYALSPVDQTPLCRRMERLGADPRQWGIEGLQKPVAATSGGTAEGAACEFEPLAETAPSRRSSVANRVFVNEFNAAGAELQGEPGMTFPNEPESRIAPLSTDDLSPKCVEILGRLPGKGLQGEGFPRNLLGILMQNQETLEPFLDYWVTSKSKMGLSVREQELVILRMAVLYRSEYVWKHHVKVGREFGIVDQELDAIRQGSYSALAKQRERALLELTDAFVNARHLPPELWNSTKRVLKPRDFVDLISLVSQYVLFSLNNVCMQVQVEPGVADLPGIGE